MKATKKQAGKRSGRGAPGGKRTASARSAYAPTLRWHMAPTPGFATRIEIPSDAADVCRAEFRALLAVARAAMQVTPGHDYFAFDGAGHSRGDHVLPKDCRGCRLDRALARLSRAGGER